MRKASVFGAITQQTTGKRTVSETEDNDASSEKWGNNCIFETTECYQKSQIRRIKKEILEIKSDIGHRKQNRDWNNRKKRGKSLIPLTIIL